MQGINEVRQMDIFRILSGILHMGNVLIEKDERAIDKCHIAVSYHHCICNFIWSYIIADSILALNKLLLNFY